ncbi:GntR family transcriptional regulator [Streptosporangium sp. NBC_01755]|uniref:GntR family transcriptional regulator n=1 Tax=Streptosporangium sp. NBC_01755 TaxID=2975949 RepID=UPI002DDA2453|nr:GntR family transcriptional regulator [Streptosporangium sp. NBC_01755]WSD03194.1 GntR family transcriptional regulator [Streptosporangium sp. NBC_01755]
MINPEADRPVYKQLADLVRSQIARGALEPGQRVPAEKDYVDRYGISRDSVRRAMATLRSEGLIITTARGSRVRPEQPRQSVIIGPADRVTARMPSPEERLQLGVKEGVPVLVVEREGEKPRLLAADRTEICGEALGESRER